eukprot:6185649-Pleurochrysis_carterae.AAC.1
MRGEHSARIPARSKEAETRQGKAVCKAQGAAARCRARGGMGRASVSTLPGRHARTQTCPDTNG